MSREEALENGKLFAQEIGCLNGGSDWNASEVFMCLGNKTVSEIFDAQVSGKNLLQKIKDFECCSQVLSLQECILRPFFRTSLCYF